MSPDSVSTTMKDVRKQKGGAVSAGFMLWELSGVQWFKIVFKQCVWMVVERGRI